MASQLTAHPPITADLSAEAGIAFSTRRHRDAASCCSIIMNTARVFYYNHFALKATRNIVLRQLNTSWWSFLGTDVTAKWSAV